MKFLHCKLIFLALQTIRASSKTLYCGTDIHPFVSCIAHPTGQKFGGYEKSIIQSVEGAGGSIEDIDYHFKCFDSFDDAFNATKNCSCDAMIGHITPTVRRKQIDNIQFTQPHLATSVATVVRRTNDKSMFKFLYPFETTLWITILFIPVVYALVFACSNILNRYLNGKFILNPPGRSLTAFVSEFFHTVFGAGELRDFESEDDPLGGFFFNINILAFSFFFLFITSVYTANLASLIISSSAALNIDDIEVLSSRPGLKILTNEIYIDFLMNQYNIRADPWTWLKNSTSYNEAVDMVANGTYDALISDRGTLLWAVRERKKCDVTLLPGSDLSYFSVSTAFSPCFDPDAIDKYNTHLFQVRDSGDIDRIGRTALGSLYYTSVGIASVDTYLNPACSDSDKIGLDDISGLLIVISVPLFFVAALPLMTSLFRKARRIEIPVS